jgi:hypothetical protein
MHVIEHQKWRRYHAEFDLIPEGICAASIHLVESMDELLAICYLYMDFDPTNISSARIFKMEKTCGDEELVAWHLVDDVGDRVFLLTGTNMATWCYACTNNPRGSTLYFLVHLVAGHRDLCIYDVQKQTMEVGQVHDHEDLEIMHTQSYWINVPPC